MDLIKKTTLGGIFGSCTGFFIYSPVKSTDNQLLEQRRSVSEMNWLIHERGLVRQQQPTNVLYRMTVEMNYSAASKSDGESPANSAR